MELVEFLRARADDDRNRADALHALAAAMPAPETADWLRDLADWMLREVEAKRAILDELEMWISAVPADREVRSDYRDAAMVILPLLAPPYADHPDYQQEWESETVS